MTTVVRMNSAEQRKTAYVTSALFFLVQEGTVFFFLFFYTYSLRACIVLCTEVFFLLISNAIQSERSEVFFCASICSMCASSCNCFTNKRPIEGKYVEFNVYS